jgi:hypothetical protein
MPKGPDIGGAYEALKALVAKDALKAYEALVAVEALPVKLAVIDEVLFHFNVLAL